ncbi:MAG: carbohydrate kinase family protein [Erysipelotrichaceae bacterium]|nr:carbohydrate kinase family protein [Erysipelotrichaceae bacterium]
MGIVVFGAVFVDIKGYPIAQYIPSGRNVGRVVQVHGGVSRNVAEDIANVQLRPVYVSVVDNTGIGNDVIARLRKHNVNTDYIIRTPDGLGTWLAIFDNNGDVVASISKRPDLSLIKEVLDKQGDKIISEADSVVVEIDMEVDLLTIIFNLAEKYNKQIFAVVSNMSLAMERRAFLSRVSCIVCNEQEAELLFSEEYEGLSIPEFEEVLCDKVEQAEIKKMVVTLGEKGAIYVEHNGEHGFCPSQKVDVVDTTGAGDSFFAGVAIGLTYGKSLCESCNIGTRLASAVIATNESVSPRFQPAEFGLEGFPDE